MTVLRIEHLNQIFGRNTPTETYALRDLNLALEQGDFVTVIGGNGAGKSTLLNSVAGFLPVSSGKISLDGQDVTTQNVAQRAKMISRVFQDPRSGTASHLTIEENLALALQRGTTRRFWRMGVRKQDHEKLETSLAQLHLGLENRLKDEMGLLSGGQRQAITLLMATLETPRLLLLDEHTAALDPKTSATVMSLTSRIVERNHLTALMVTHNMQDAIRYGNRLLMLSHGKIVLDLDQEAKQHLTVPDLMARFKETQGTTLSDDSLLLS